MTPSTIPAPTAVHPLPLGQDEFDYLWCDVQRHVVLASADGIDLNHILVLESPAADSEHRVLFALVTRVQKITSSTLPDAPPGSPRSDRLKDRREVETFIVSVRVLLKHSVPHG